jgi:hypothetical protein
MDRAFFYLHIKLIQGSEPAEAFDNRINLK